MLTGLISLVEREREIERQFQTAFGLPSWDPYDYNRPLGAEDFNVQMS